MDKNVNHTFKAPTVLILASFIIPNNTPLMIGDSVTDCGRVSPAAEAVRDPLGYGYVKLIHNLLAATCPWQHIRILNRGISGNKLRDRTARWQSDFLDLKPDWLSILIAINDVWPKFDVSQMSGMSLLTSTPLHWRILSA
jgi:hypothetical protein